MFAGNIVIFIMLGIFLLFFVSYILQWLWNITMTEVFGLKPITYWQAFRLLLIAGILFGGMRYNFNL